MFKVASLFRNFALPVLAGLVVGTFAYAQSTGWSPGPLSGTQAIAYLSNGTTFDPAVNGAGTATRSLRVTMASDSPGLAGGTSKILDSAGTNLASVNAAGLLAVDVNNVKATYVSSIPLTAVAATPTDMFCLVGSATKTVRVFTFTMFTTGGTTLPSANVIIKRTAANTGGTSTTITPALMDTSTAAATAVMTLYSANPASLGAGITIGRATSQNNATAPTGSPTFSGGNSFVTPVTLRGVAQALCFNGAADAATANIMASAIVWTEE